VLGRAAHSILIWRLEQGERIGTLDILATSTSLTSAVTCQFQLRRFSPLGVGLILLWTLSPIGGQGSIRQIAIGETITTQQQSYEYLAPDGDIYQWGADILNSHFRAALLSPTTILTSPSDLWGNVKIPWIESYERDSTPDIEGWFTVALGSSDIYSSFVGIPISAITSVEFVNYDVNIETMYLRLNCSLYPFGPIRDFSNNATRPTAGELYWTNNSATRAETDQKDLAPFEMITHKISFYPDPGRCSVTTTYVEVAVTCQTYTTCASSKIRRSHLLHPLPAYTQLDSHGSDLWNHTLHGIMEADTSAYVYGGSVMSRFLDSSESLNSTFSHKIGEMIFNEKFGQVLNAYWIYLNGYQAIVDGVMETSTTALSYDVSWPYQDYRTKRHTYLAHTWPAEGTKSVRTEIIQAHKEWVTTLAIASIFLMLGSLVPPYVRGYFTKCPDLMMNVSSLATRNNPLIPLPMNGTFMNASERSRLLKDVEVRFGDVNSTANVGSLAIGVVNMRGVPKVGRVRMSRFYVSRLIFGDARYNLPRTTFTEGHQCPKNKFFSIAL
jgi:hypothetical protein